MHTQAWKQRTALLTFRLLDAVAPRIAASRAYILFSTPRPGRPSARDQQVMDSAKRLQSVYANGALTGYTWGEGPAVLLVHGWEGSAQNFSALVMPLVSAGFRVIAFDGPAHGHSDGSRTSAVEYAGALAALITEFGPMYGVVAHSLGAAAIVFMMGTMKHRRIERLALVGAPCELNDVLARFAGGLNLTERSQRHMRQLIHRRLGIPPSALSISAMVPYIATPGLVIHDRQDATIPFSDAETIAAHWPDSQLLATDGLGHHKILRDPATIERIVQFMAPSGRP